MEQNMYTNQGLSVAHSVDMYECVKFIGHMGTPVYMEMCILTWACNSQTMRWPNSGISRFSDSHMVRWPYGQMLTCIGAQMLRCIDAQMLKRLDGLMVRWSDSQMIRRPGNLLITCCT
jgi:hypothetical protein